MGGRDGTGWDQGGKDTKMTQMGTTSVTPVTETVVATYIMDSEEPVGECLTEEPRSK